MIQRFFDTLSNSAHFFKIAGWIIVVVFLLASVYIMKIIIPKNRFKNQKVVEGGEVIAAILSVIAVIIFFMILYNS